MSTSPTIKLFSPLHPSPLTEKKLSTISLHVYQNEKLDPARSTHLICCSDYTIRKLNRDFRGKDKTTDVLSFMFDDADLLGEIYISIRRTEIQARRFNVPVKEEFLRLFLHGLLHLAGYDHIREADRTIMEPAEAYYLTMALRLR